MASLRKLNRHLRVWRRYTSRYPYSPPAKGHTRAVLAVALERDTRQLYEGGWYDKSWDDEECLGDCCLDGGDEDDFYDGEGYPWPPGVVTERAFAEQGLL